MSKALSVAYDAFNIGNFPVGCVIEYGGDIIVSGARTSSVGKNINEIDHAEINALRQLSSLRGNYDFSKMTIYCTLEPCLMCFGAILLSGIRRIVFAYEDVMGGVMQCDLSKLPSFYSFSDIKIISKVLRSKSLSLFKSFFRNPENSYLVGSQLSLYTLEQ